MCTVSMIMDHYREKWTPYIPQQPWPVQPFTPPLTTQTIILQPQLSQEEIDEFHRLLERAREYDKRMGEPDCEIDEKKQALLAIAKILGVELSFL